MCAIYLGSKLPLNNRALRTFSCIDPTARGSEWTVRQVTENDTRVAVMGAPPSGKKRFYYMWGLFTTLSRYGCLLWSLLGVLFGLAHPPPSPPTKINFCGRPWLLSLAGYVGE